MSPSSQTSTPNPESFTKLRRSIVMGGAIAVLVTGLAVTLVALGPFYSTLARLQETHLLSIVTSRSAAIEEYLFRLKEVARQITSRTRAREKLEELNRGEATLLEFQSYVGPILTDALMGAEHVEGITRCDVNGNAVLEVGIQIPQSFWLGTKGDGGSPRVVGPVNIRTRPSLLIRTPIVNRTGEQVGTDLVLFSAERLLQIVRNETGLGKHAGILFFDRAADESNPGVFGTRDGSPPAAEKIDFASELTKVMDTEPAGFAQRNGMFAAFATVASTRWALVLFLPVDVVYAPSRLQIGWVLAVVALLLAAGTYGVTILLRPLSGRVMLRAEELETELAERRVSEARHRALFEQSPIGIWEEDYSGVKRIIDRLRDEGVTDFRTHFSEHPELVREAAVAIRLLAANEAAFKIYQASNLEEFRGLSRDVTARSRSVIPVQVFHRKTARECSSHFLPPKNLAKAQEWGCRCFTVLPTSTAVIFSSKAARRAAPPSGCCCRCRSRSRFPVRHHRSSINLSQPPILTGIFWW